MVHSIWKKYQLAQVQYFKIVQISLAKAACDILHNFEIFLTVLFPNTVCTTTTGARVQRSSGLIARG